MPAFLKAKLEKEYPGNDKAVYGTMNAIGAMKGSKETPKGEAMDAKHAADMKKKKDNGKIPGSHFGFQKREKTRGDISPDRK